MFPTQEKLIQGASAVRDWFRRRQKRALFVRRHRIVLTMQDLMEQVAEQRPRVCGAAFFEADTSHEDERWFAVVPEHFWERVSLSNVQRQYIERCVREYTREVFFGSGLRRGVSRLEREGTFGECLSGERPPRRACSRESFERSVTFHTFIGYILEKRPVSV